MPRKIGNPRVSHCCYAKSLHKPGSHSVDGTWQSILASAGKGVQRMAYAPVIYSTDTLNRLLDAGLENDDCGFKTGGRDSKNTVP